MRFVGKILFSLVLLVASPCLGQEDLLPDGAYGTTIHGGIKAGEKKAFQLNGEAGQVLKAHVFTKGLEKGVTLEILDSDGESLLGELGKLTKIDTLDLVLPRDDQYFLHVRAGTKTCSYILEVTLEDAPKKPPSRTRGKPGPPPQSEREPEEDVDRPRSRPTPKSKEGKGATPRTSRVFSR